MIVVKLSDYWQGIVDYYYEHVQPTSPNKSIWEWVDENFNCSGSLYSKVLKFTNEQDFVAFRLLIPKK